MKIKFTYLLAALTFLMAACTKEEINHTVTFDTDGGTYIEDQIVMNGTLATTPENPLKAGYEFEAWYDGAQIFDFESPVNSDLNLKANWSVGAGETAFDFDNISKENFETLPKGSELLVKATISRLGTWPSAWGCEVWLLDSYGNSSKELYDHTPYGMFSFPLSPEGFEFDREYVFRLHKDAYMSSPQLGFGPLSCFYDWAWQCDYRYGIEYFDDALRGNVREVKYVEGTGVQILLGEDKVVTFPELDDTTELEAFLSKNVLVYVLMQEDAYSSVLADGALQVFEFTEA